MKMLQYISANKIIRLVFVWLIVAYIVGGIYYALPVNSLDIRHAALPVLGVSLLVATLLLAATDRCSYLSDLLRYKAFDRREFSEFYHIDRFNLIVIIIIIIIAFALRIIGYRWGIVASWQPDETKIVSSSVIMASNKVLYSSRAIYPNQFVSKFVAIIAFLYAHIHHISLYYGTMIEAVHIYRFIVAIFGTATVYLAFLIGNAIRRNLGLVFAGFTALFPYYISLSKQVTSDITTCFFLTLCMTFSIRYCTKQSDRYLLLMTMAVSMATLEKWHGAAGMGYVGFVLIFGCGGIKEYIIKGVKALIMYILWLFVLAPNIVINLKSTVYDGFLTMAVYDDQARKPYLRMLWGYLRFGFEHIGGIIYLLIMIAGVIYIISHISRYYIVLAMGLIKTLALCMLNRQMPRWDLELYYTELLLVSIGILFMIDFVKSGTIWKIAMGGVGMICGCIVILEMLTGTVLTDQVAAYDDHDSRLVQRQDCLDMGIAPDNMISQNYTGFAASSGCDRDYPELGRVIDDWNGYVYEENGCWYRTEECPEYICLNVGSGYTDDILAAGLKDICSRVLSYRIVCGDTFRMPFTYTDFTLNDISVIRQNAKLISDIENGALYGDNIDVFYVENLPASSRQ